MTSSNDRQPSRIERELKKLVDDLRPDGPPPDDNLIEEYACGMLEADEAKEVGHNIATYRSWYERELDVRCAMTRYENEPCVPDVARMAESQSIPLHPDTPMTVPCSDHIDIQTALSGVATESWEQPWKHRGLLPGVQSILKSFALDAENRLPMSLDSLRTLAGQLLAMSPLSAAEDLSAFSTTLNGHTRTFCSQLAKCSAVARDTYMSQAGTRSTGTLDVEAQLAHRNGLLNSVLWVLAHAEE